MTAVFDDELGVFAAGDVVAAIEEEVELRVDGVKDRTIDVVEEEAIEVALLCAVETLPTLEPSIN